MSAPDLPRPLGDVRSYVRRTSRMTQSQQKAWDRDAARFVIDLPGLPQTAVVPPRPPLDLGAVFGRDADLVVEIGPGMGESLVPMAAARPECNVLAFEVYQAGAAGIVHKAGVAGIDNVRVVMADAASGVEHLLPPSSISELWTFFPDPWHKLRHRKRRLVRTAFANLVATRLHPGGLWRLATDWEDYARGMRKVLDPHPGFTNLHSDVDGWAPRWDDRPMTRFEQRGIDAGRDPRDLTYRRD